MQLPEPFTRMMLALHGAEGAAWLEALPALVEACALRWNLTIGPPFPNLSYNYVAPATCADGSAAVLKLGVPHPELRTEIAALGLYAGRGAARLLEADPEGGALLIERLQPGSMLANLADDVQATRIAAQLMRELWRPLPPEHPFPNLARWGRALARVRTRFGGSGPLPARHFTAAEALFRDLLASSASPVLLHGDLHHFNILADGTGWRAIDPKGLAGEPAYEPGALLLNPSSALLSWPDARMILARRSSILAEVLGLDQGRIAAWAYVQAVLSACWSLDEGGDAWKRAMAIAELLAP